MKANQLVHLLVPAIILSLPANTNNWGEIDDGASSFVIGESKESSTTPGGFSSVAEPAGPSDTKSTEQSPPLKHQARSTSTSLTPTEPHHKGL